LSSARSIAVRSDIAMTARRSSIDANTPFSNGMKPPLTFSISLVSLKRTWPAFRPMSGNGKIE